jgi:hypothetical protein
VFTTLLVSRLLKKKKRKIYQAFSFFFFVVDFSVFGRCIPSGQSCRCCGQQNSTGKKAAQVKAASQSLGPCRGVRYVPSVVVNVGAVKLLFGEFNSKCIFS